MSIYVLPATTIGHPCSHIVRKITIIDPLSKNNLLLSLKRTKEGIRLVDQYSIKTTAHTISDYENLIFYKIGNKSKTTKKNQFRINR